MKTFKITYEQREVRTADIEANDLQDAIAIVTCRVARDILPVGKFISANRQHALYLTDDEYHVVHQFTESD